MPTVEGLKLSYELHLLPPGRVPFRRWRWKLWHGPSLIASGWRLARPDAGRALRVAALEFSLRFFGLPVPPRDARVGVGDLRPGVVERVALGPTTCLLVPRELDSPPGAVAFGSLSLS